jgi:manganese efflux pump family protein
MPMPILQIILIAFALAMDAFAVSVAGGFAIRRVRLRHALTYGLWFGGFQALMPLLGWLGGMIKEVEESKDPLEPKTLLLLAIATSIDALAVGLSFALLKVTVFIPALVIGVVTFGMSYVGVYIGAKGSHFFERKIEVAGGVILIAIGCKILWSHLMAP